VLELEKYRRGMQKYKIYVCSMELNDLSHSDTVIVEIAVKSGFNESIFEESFKSL